MTGDETLYEERDGIAIIAINRPEKKNTLTNSVIQGIEDGINQAYENMGLRTTQLLGTLFDGMTRHTEEAYRWVDDFAAKGFRQTIRDRDRPWGDYGEKDSGDGA